MKTRLHLIVTAAVMASVVCISGLRTITAQAQSARLNVKIPFAFHVGLQKFRPGVYKLEKITPLMCRIQDSAGHVGAVVATNPAMPVSQQHGGKLVFNHYNNDYFLSQVWWADYPVGNEILKTSLELELAKKMLPLFHTVPVAPIREARK